jgi:alpha-glucosidase
VRRGTKGCSRHTGDLAGLRRGSVALLRGGLRWVYAAGDALVFLREAPGETALVHVARAAHDPVRIDVRDLLGISDSMVGFGGGGELEAFTLTLGATGPDVSVRIWATGTGGSNGWGGR